MNISLPKLSSVNFQGVLQASSHIGKGLLIGSQNVAKVAIPFLTVSFLLVTKTKLLEDRSIEGILRGKIDKFAVYLENKGFITKNIKAKIEHATDVMWTFNLIPIFGGITAAVATCALKCYSLKPLSASQTSAFAIIALAAYACRQKCKKNSPEQNIAELTILSAGVAVCLQGLVSLPSLAARIRLVFNR